MPKPHVHQQLPLVDITTEANKVPTQQRDNADRAFQLALDASRTVDKENPIPLRSLYLPNAPTQQLQQKPGSKSKRGLGFPLTFRLAVVDIFRFAHRFNPDMTANNFHEYVDLGLGKNSIYLCERDYDKIKFDVQHGRGAYCKLSSDEEDVVLHYVNKSVAQWLEHMQNRGFSVGGQQMSEVAKSMYFALIDSCSPEFRRPGRQPAFAASWRAAMARQYGTVDCKVAAQQDLVDTNDPHFVARMEQLRNICGQYSLEDIYNCDETGMYLKELTTGQTPSKSKIRKGPRVSILLCINASGSSFARSQRMTALRPQVLSKHMPQDRDLMPTHLMTPIKNESGYMTRDIFLAWLRLFDSQLTRPSLLILDSCTAHAGIEEGDPERGTPWEHLHIERLPPNSTSITQPLDKGVISVFKRCLLELLCNKSISEALGSEEEVSNGLAWALIPYAWSHIKETTLRHCFRAAKVFSRKKEREQESLDLVLPDFEQQRQPLWPPAKASTQHQIRENSMRFVASAIDGCEFTFSQSLDKDAQEMAEATMHKLRSEMQAKREIWNKRGRSSSLEAEEIKSYDASTQGEITAAEVKRLLTDNNPAF